MIETEAGTESTYSFDHRLKRFKKKAADTLSASFAFILLRFFESYDKLKYFILGQPVTPQISKYSTGQNVQAVLLSAHNAMLIIN